MRGRDKKKKMNGKLQQKNIFESSFESFEFDDAFLMKVDSDIKKNNINEKKFHHPKVKSKEAIIHKEIEKKTYNNKAQYYDLPLFAEDLNESDFFCLTEDKKKNSLPQVTKVQENEQAKKIPSNGITGWLSPIHGPKFSDKVNLYSSTPVKPDEIEKPKASQKLQENVAKNSEFDYLEADLFDDWGVGEIAKENTQKEKITFSQALKLIEEAESAVESVPQSFNRSIDLLTGEMVDVGNMFEESFGLWKSSEKTNDKASANKNIILEKNYEVGCKPPAAQKLNFESEKANDCNPAVVKENHFNSICFSSDDDFDFFDRELLEKRRKVSEPSKLETGSSNFTKDNTAGFLNESSDAVVIGSRSKARKCFKIVELDTTEDSPSPKFRRRNKAKKLQHSQESFGREFIDLEAEVSDEVGVSSDETDEEGEYDKSFLDENSFCTQNHSAHMTTKYLESVKFVKRPGAFKIPEAKPYNILNVFSQIPEDNNTDYEIDSFCVNDIEEDLKADLSDLEVAERILEINRKKKKKRRNQKLKKLK